MTGRSVTSPNAETRTRFSCSFLNDFSFDHVRVVVEVGDGLAEEFGEACRVTVGVMVGHLDAGVAHDGCSGVVGHVRAGGHRRGPVAGAVDVDHGQVGGGERLAPVVSFAAAADGVAS